tara:strand:+ start:62 stop:508 length:447 start_codon:yes stop_codon:yes gene_type:complete
MADYKGKTKAEVRALVLANNKKASDSHRDNPKKKTHPNMLSVRAELALWKHQNRNLSVKSDEVSKASKTNKTNEKAPEETTSNKEQGFANYGIDGVVNKDLLKKETYVDMVREMGLNDDYLNDPTLRAKTYKPSATPKRGFIMKRNRK